MERIFLEILKNGITASYMILAVIAFRLIFKKAPRYIHCILWGLVALRLILPFSIESSLSILPEREAAIVQLLQEESTEVEETPAEEILPEPTASVLPEYSAPVIPEYTVPEYTANVIPEYTEPVIPEYTAPEIYEPEIPETPETPVIPQEPENADAPSVLFIVSIVWISVAGLMVLWAVASYVRLKIVMREGVGYKDNVYFSDRCRTPFVLGVFTPDIYLPSDIDSADIPYVLSHERAHIKRGDHISKLIAHFILSIYWFNPLVILAYFLYSADIELACDEKVIKRMSADEKKAYSTALLSCSTRRYFVSACPVAFGEVGVKMRIKSVLNYKKPSFWLMVLAVSVMAVISVTMLTDPKAEASPLGDAEINTLKAEPMEDTETDVPDNIPATEPETETAVDTPTAEPETEPTADNPATEPEIETAVDTPITEPETETTADNPIAEPETETAVDTPTAEPETETAVDTPTAEPETEPTVDTPATEPETETTVDTPITEPETDPTVDTPITEPETEPTVDTPADERIAEVIDNKKPQLPTVDAPIVMDEPLIAPESGDKPLYPSNATASSTLPAPTFASVVSKVPGARNGFSVEEETSDTDITVYDAEESEWLYYPTQLKYRLRHVYAPIMLNDEPFWLQTEQGEEKVYLYSFEHPYSVKSFDVNDGWHFLVDTDRDGYEEMVLNWNSKESLVLRYEDGKVKGYPLDVNTLYSINNPSSSGGRDIYTDGSFDWRLPADNSYGSSRLVFDGEEYVCEELWYVYNNSTYFVRGANVSKDSFTLKTEVPRVKTVMTALKYDVYRYGTDGLVPYESSVKLIPESPLSYYHSVTSPRLVDAESFEWSGYRPVFSYSLNRSVFYGTLGEDAHTVGQGVKAYDENADWLLQTDSIKQYGINSRMNTELDIFDSEYFYSGEYTLSAYNEKYFKILCGTRETGTYSPYVCVDMYHNNYLNVEQIINGRYLLITALYSVTANSGTREYYATYLYDLQAGRYTFLADNAHHPVMSPDMRYLAYTSGDDYYVLDTKTGNTLCVEAVKGAASIRFENWISG